MIYFVFLALVLGQQSPWYTNYDGAIIELTGQNPSVFYGPLDASDSLTLTRNASEDKLVCSGEFEAANLRIAGTSTTVADLISKVGSLEEEIRAVRAFVGMMPPPASPPPTPPPLWSIFYSCGNGRNLPYFGSFETPPTSSNEVCLLQRLPSHLLAATTTIRVEVSGGACINATIEFGINDNILQYFRDGTQNHWQTLINPTVVQGTVANVPTQVWTGDSVSNNGFILGIGSTGSTTSTVFASSYNRYSSAWNQRCNGQAVQGGEWVQMHYSSDSL